MPLSAQAGSDPVTRDALRADLGEVKAEIITVITSTVEPIHEALAAQARGEFTQAQLMVVASIAEKVIDTRTSGVWTRRARAITVVSVVVAALGLFTSAAMAATLYFGG